MSVQIDEARKLAARAFFKMTQMQYDDAAVLYDRATACVGVPGIAANYRESAADARRCQEEMLALKGR